MNVKIFRKEMLMADYCIVCRKISEKGNTYQNGCFVCSACDRCRRCSDVSEPLVFRIGSQPEILCSDCLEQVITEEFPVR